MEKWLGQQVQSILTVYISGGWYGTTTVPVDSLVVGCYFDDGTVAKIYVHVFMNDLLFSSAFAHRARRASTQCRTHLTSNTSHKDSLLPQS